MSRGADFMDNQIDRRFLARPNGQLIDHLINVGAISKNLAGEYSEVIWLASVLHDLGKATDTWQKYLIKSVQAWLDYKCGKRQKPKKDTIPHAVHGAVILLERELKGRNKYEFISFLIASTIRSHHGSLKFVNDKDGENNRSTIRECKSNTSGYVSALPQIKSDHYPIKREKDLFDNWLLLKYMFSVMVDADREDAMRTTENGHSNGVNNTVNYNRSHFDLSQSGKIVFKPHFTLPEGLTDDPIKKDFREVLLKSIWTNLNTITAPCGLGKTIASLAKACQIANTEGKSRIIYVAALKTILEQTADVYKSCLSGQQVLEHHSDYEPENKDDEEELRDYEYNCQTWNSEIIVTTMVQFVDSLLSPHCSKNRKLHNLDNSVVILDEVQTLPEHLLIYVLLCIDFLSKHHNVTFVLMSATQPHFKNLNYLGINKMAFNELVPADKITEYYKVRELATVVNRTKERDIVKVASEYDQPKLVIVNTTQQAQNFYQIMSEKQPGQWVHLSSRMCPDHRREVIKLIRENDNLNIISTQVVEAGVDISRPVVISQLAPLDSLIQRMGRCNRFGIGPDGLFVVVDCLKRYPYSQLRLDITESILTTRDIVGEQCDVVRDYFQAIYDLRDTRLNKESPLVQGQVMVKQLIERMKILYLYASKGQLPEKEKADFSWLNHNDYRSIPKDNKNTVLCLGYGGFPLEMTKEKLIALTPRDKADRRVLKSLSKYQATVPGYVEGIEDLGNGLCIWTGDYDQDCGVIW